MGGINLITYTDRPAVAMLQQHSREQHAADLLPWALIHGTCMHVRITGATEHMHVLHQTSYAADSFGPIYTGSVRCRLSMLTSHHQASDAFWVSMADIKQ